MFGNMGEMMKKVQKMQAQMAESQKILESLEVEGVSGGGRIKITADGKGTIKGVKIDPAVVNPEEVDILEDLMLAALLDVQAKADAKGAEEMAKATGGLKLPGGMKLPF
jgi:DNA-binding YbaB/EbfC family protein